MPEIRNRASRLSDLCFMFYIFYFKLFMKLHKTLPRAVVALFHPLTMNAGPENIQVDITTACNLRCVMCPRYFLESDDRSRHMEWGALKKIIEEIRPGSANLAGTGEPLLYPHFFELVRLCKATDNAATITSSNFTLADRTVIEQLLDSGLDVLKVSIDAVETAAYAAIRGVDALERIGDSLMLLHEIKRAKKRATPSVRIDCVILRENVEQMGALICWAAAHHAETVMFRLLDTTRIEDERKVTLTKDINAVTVIQELFSAEKIASDHGISTNIHALLRQPEYIALNYGGAGAVKKLRRGVCLLPWMQLFVTVNGDISPCCSLYPSGEKGEAFTGNIFKEGFTSVWNGSAMQEVRRQFRTGENYQRYRACARCNPMTLRNLAEAAGLFPGIMKL